MSLRMERFLVNPVKKSGGKKKRKTKKKGTSMTKTKKKNKPMTHAARVAAGKKAARTRKRNLAAAKRSKKRVSKKLIRKITRKPRHRITVYGPKKFRSGQRRRWYRSPVSKSKKRRIRINRNPKLMTQLGLGKLQKMLPAIGTGVLGSIVTVMAPAMIQKATGNPGMIFKYGSMIGANLGGTMLFGMIVKNKALGGSFMLGSGIAIGLEIVRDFILPNMGLNIPGFADNDSGYGGVFYDDEGYGAFPDEVGVGAFPEEFADDPYTSGGNTPY